MRHAMRFGADRHSHILLKGLLFWVAFMIVGLASIRLLDGVVTRSADRLTLAIPNDAQLAGIWASDRVVLRNQLQGDWLQVDLWTGGVRPRLLRSLTLHRGPGQGLFHLRHVFASNDVGGPTLSMSGSLLTLQLPVGEAGRFAHLSFHRAP